jgi:Trypsin-like peptidase domain
MKIPQIREALSWVPLKVKPTVNGEELSIATGFLYQHNGRAFLITNYHVVSGRHPETGRVLHPSGYCPDSIVLDVATDAGKHEQSGKRITKWEWRTLSLFSEAEPAKHIWTEHPEHGSRFDAVAIPFPGAEDTRITAANADSLGLDKIRVYPSMEAFVLGYPLGMSGGAHFPIWKRATIATEPDFDLDGLPRFYIDTATRKGMSGAPVYAQEVGYWLPEGESDQSKALIGKGRRFVGVYSGRLGADDEFKAQLGIVWKESALISLIESALAGSDES